LASMFIRSSFALLAYVWSWYALQGKTTILGKALQVGEDAWESVTVNICIDNFRHLQEGCGPSVNVSTLLVFFASDVMILSVMMLPTKVISSCHLYVKCD